MKGEELVLIIGMRHFDSILVTHIQELFKPSYFLPFILRSGEPLLFLASSSSQIKPTTFANLGRIFLISCFITLFFFTFFSYRLKLLSRRFSSRLKKTRPISDLCISCVRSRLQSAFSIYIRFGSLLRFLDFLWQFLELLICPWLCKLLSFKEDNDS